MCMAIGGVASSLSVRGMRGCPLMVLVGGAASSRAMTVNVKPSRSV